MASLIYNDFKESIMNGSIDLDTDTIKVALVTSSYTPDQDTHDFFDDVTNEITGTGYTAGGATLASKTVTQDNTNNRGVFDAADPSWASSTLTARGAVIYKSTGTPGTSRLICYIDFGQDYTSANGTFSIVFHADGILYIG
jgi:hypothetical protein